MKFTTVGTRQFTQPQQPENSCIKNRMQEQTLQLSDPVHYYLYSYPEEYTAAFSSISGTMPKMPPVSSNPTGCVVCGDCNPIASDQQQHISPQLDSGIIRH